jgi:hypothetical protein
MNKSQSRRKQRLILDCLVVDIAKSLIQTNMLHDHVYV